MTSENNLVLPEYVAKRFGILASDIDDKNVVLMYQNELSKKELEDLAFILGKAVSLGEKISKEEFQLHFKNIYSSLPINTSKKTAITIPPTINEADMKPTDQESVFNNEPSVSDNLTAEEFIKTLPLSLLEKEIKRRYLSTNLSGIMNYDENGVSFKIDKMNWPQGKYIISIQYLDEVN